MYYKKICIGGRIFTESGDLELFHRNFFIDANLSGMSDVTVTWKHYEYVMVNQPYSSILEPKRINYVEDEIIISQLMGVFQN